MAVAACGAAIASSVRFAVAGVSRIAVQMVDVLAAPDKMDRTGLLGAPQRQMQAAQAFYERLAKRERPTIRSTWRMCPSM